MTEIAASGRAGDTARVFFALWPPPPLAEQLAAHAAQWVGTAGGRATRRETIHLTLAFLGDVAADRLTDLCVAAGRTRGEPCEMVLDRAGIWRHNRIAWIGCTTVPLPLAMLADQLAAEVAAAGFPVADPGRRFVPHLTLIRKVRDPAAPGPPFLPFTWSCNRFVLVRSRLGRQGSDYEHLAEFPLAGR